MIDVIPNTENSSLPWLFRLPFRKESIEMNNQVENKLNLLSKALFDISTADRRHPIVTQLSQSNQIEFLDSKKHNLRSNLIVVIRHININLKPYHL